MSTTTTTTASTTLTPTPATGYVIPVVRVPEELKVIPKVYCKYLGIPLERVFGISYSIEGTTERRLVGPFFSLGVAVRYYQKENKEGRIKSSKYGQYLYNICEQLHVWENPEKTRILSEYDEENKAWKLIPKQRLVKQTDLMEKVLIGYLPPVVDCLETHGGSLTRQQYLEADPSRQPALGIVGMSVEDYQYRKTMEMVKRKKNRTLHKQREYSLYAVGFAKNKTDIQEIHRIDLNNDAFQRFISPTNKSLRQRTQKFRNGGCRIIYSAGQNINYRATRLLYSGLPKEERDKRKIKGMCFVFCTASADLRLQGFLPLNKDWTPTLDAGDQEDDVNSDSEEGDDDQDGMEEIEYEVEELPKQKPEEIKVPEIKVQNVQAPPPVQQVEPVPKALNETFYSPPINSVNPVNPVPTPKTTPVEPSKKRVSAPESTPPPAKKPRQITPKPTTLPSQPK